ncbi:protein argonaute 4-like [Nymphaea colorata]|nr:protein argonaute 4-like [Nymphaea colorata]
MEKESLPTDLPPPPPVIPPNVVPIKADFSNARVPMARKGTGSLGQRISLLANHFAVRRPTNMDACFFHYSVSVTSEDSRAVESKGIGRKIMDKVQQTYSSELSQKDFAYDGEKSLFTYGELPKKTLNFTVILERSNGRGGGDGNGNGSPSDGERKRMKRGGRSRKFDVEISFAAKIPLRQIEAAMRGEDSGQEALRVLDIILRQHAAKKGCLLVRQSFFHDDSRNFVDIGGGVVGCRGFHSSFRPTQGGLSLNIDVTTTMILKPGPVINFLLENQNVRDPFRIDWQKARRMLKNLRIRTTHNSMEFKIFGLSEHPCNQQYFSLRVKNGGNPDAQDTREVTVYEYFRKEKGVELKDSASLPCIDAGRPNHPNYIPIELCSLLSLQRYTKSLSSQQRASLVEKSRQKPQERMRTLTDAMRSNRYHEDPILSACGINFSDQFVQLEGRILPSPKLVFGNGESFAPRNGRWNLNQKQMLQPIRIQRWAIVNFSARCDTEHLARELINTGRNKGIQIEPPFATFEESPQFRNASPVVRVDKMFDQLKSGLPGPPEFILCVLSERKNSYVYGPWKKKTLSDVGIVTQCIAPSHKINDQYLTNVLLKINSKLGGINSLLSIEKTPSIPIISTSPTIILGLDVSHGSPGHSDMPSIAAVVSSREWPLISRYRAAVRTQSPKVEMIDSLFKPSVHEDKKTDHGIINELLIDFYQSSRQRKPEKMIIFRDGVSESQFNQVLNIELEQIIEACDFLEPGYRPKITLIVAQKNHHTKLFQNSPENVPPGTVVDTKICHPRNFDFYMCAHAGMIGTTRPTHYHILVDEIGFSADDLQMLVHSLSYVYQRSTTAISIVAPISYAHLAAAQMSQFIKGEYDSSDTSSSHGGVTIPGTLQIPAMPKLHEKVCTKMFFC